MARMRGYTMLEILITIAIVVALSALLFPTYQGYVRNAKEQRTISLLSKIEGGLNMYRQDFRYYPSFLGSWGDGDWDNVSLNAESLYIELFDTNDDEVGDGYLSGQVDATRDLANTGGATTKEFVDVWGRPVIYLAAHKWYICPSACGDPSPTPGDCPTCATPMVLSNAHYWPFDAPMQSDRHKWSYELWSAGSDEAFTNLRTGTGDADNLRAPGM